MNVFAVAKQRSLWILAAVIVVAGVLRGWQYWQFPILGETQDEIAWTFLGASLLQKGEPTSWSYFAGYGEPDIFQDGSTSYPLVTPTLDHPPLFAVIPGLMQTLDGQPWRSLPSIKVVRLPMVLLGTLNVMLFAWWVWRVSREHVTRWVALLVLATAPSFVFLSRLVVSENLLVTWLLLLLILATTRLAKSWQLAAVFFVHMALPLTKVAGLPLAAASIGWARTQADPRWLRASLLGTVLGVGLWLLYAASWDWSLFLQVQTQQAARGVGFLTLFMTQLVSQTLVEQVSGDVWMWLGWLAGIWFLLTQKSKHAAVELLRWQALAMIAFIFLSVGEHTVHGWYRIPLIPFFAYSLGVLAQQLWKRAEPLAVTLAVLLCAPIVRLPLAYAQPEWLHASQLMLSRAWAIVAGLPLLAQFWRPHWGEMAARRVLLFLAVIVLLANIGTVLTVNDQAFWRDALYTTEGIF